MNRCCGQRTRHLSFNHNRFHGSNSQGGHVRSFATTEAELDDIPMRSNERYDILIDIFQLQQQLQELWPRDRQSA